MAERAQVEKEVMKVVQEHFGDFTEVIMPATRLVEDLNADSLDLVELAMALEDQFGDQVPDGIEDGWATVSDMVDSMMKVLP